MIDAVGLLNFKSGAANLYAYGLNNPLFYIDPDGKLWHIPAWAAWTGLSAVFGSSTLHWWYWNVENPEPFLPPDDTKKDPPCPPENQSRPREQQVFPTSSGDPGLTRPIVPPAGERLRPRERSPRPNFPPRAR